MRLEHLEWNVSTATCAALHDMIVPQLHFDDRTLKELTNIKNELRARLQRRDQDPHVPSDVLAREAAIDPLLA